MEADDQEKGGRDDGRDELAGNLAASTLGAGARRPDPTEQGAPWPSV